ncbi:MAG: OmpA family protein [Saprospiraceae bacterium]|nr:OmpA family protein [Saprospiraceae bacterium]
MSKAYTSPTSALIFSLVFLSLHSLVAQPKANLEVNRTSAIDRTLPVLNVTVDAGGRKWASNAKGVYQIKASDFGTPLSVPAGHKNVLSFKGGNADFTWSEEAFKSQVKAECTVTSAWYDEKTTTLWLGTDEAGLFQFKTTPQLQLVQQYTNSNSKLRSKNITIIFQDKSNRLWVGTDDGLMYGPPGRWKGDFSGYEVQRIREYGNVIYVLADGEISLAPNGDKWSDLKLNKKKLEGQIADFDIDMGGKMWLVSGVLTRYDLLGDTYDVFSGPEYYTSEYGTCVAVDFDGAAWVGTSDKGLYQVDKASSMTLNAYVDKPISCAGDGKDAVLVAKVTGGVPPYTYAWSGGLSGDNPKGVGAGNYLVTVTDSKGKTRSAEVPVPDARLRIKARQKKPVSATGQSDGSAEVDMETNASGLQIRWSNGETMAVATKLPSGPHSVTVTDPKGCSAVATVVITEKAPPMAAVISEKEPVKCAGDKNASLTVQITGGKGPYKYTWSNPALSGEQPTGLQPGEYQLTVTDATGITTTATVSVKQPEALTVNVQVQSPATLSNADGKALAQAKGGTGIYAFKWDNGETAYTATKLAPGQRSVTVTDANGCSATATVSISEKITPLEVSISVKKIIKCAGEKASLVVETTGGKAPFQYNWNNPAAIGGQPDNLPAGDYALTVTDITGGSSTVTFAILEPAPIAASIAVTAPASTGNADGKATAQATGGAGTYTFKWDNGETAAAALKLAPGQRSVTVTDANGCSATATVSISENILPLAVSISEKNKINCAGDKTAALAVQVSGGKGPYKYAWNSPTLAGDQPGNLAAGDYVLTVTDAAGTASTATVSVKQPAALSAAASATAPASTGNADGKATAQATGGAGTYTFKWDNGETAAAALKLAPGQRSVTVTDANGCSATATVSISENILPLAVSISEKNKINCAGDKTAALAVQVSGGKGPYKYAWNSPTLAGDQPGNLAAGDYVLTVTDAAGTASTATVSVKQPAALSAAASATAPASTGNADGKATAQATGGAGTYTFKWDNGETAAAALKLAPGQRSVTVTDANGCSATATVSISENILPLAVSISEKNKINCAGDKTAALAVQVSGGKGPYKYAWNSPTLAGDQPGNLAAGDYVLTVTDAAGTASTATVSVKQPAALSAAASATAPASTGNADGKATAQATGGAGTYTFKWDNGETAAAALKLAPGQRSVTVTDANGCSATATVSISENILPLAVSISEKNKINCAGDKTAALAVQVSGGKGPYKYAWNSPTLAGDQPGNLAAGDYVLTVTDAAGTASTATVSVKQPAALSAAASATAPASTGNADGKATAQATGGAGTYTFKWDNGETAAAALKLAPGQRSVTVTDANGCSATATVSISENILPLAVSISEKNKINCAGDKAAFAVQVSGGKPPYNYVWNNPSLRGDQQDGVGAGEYAVTVTDALGTSQTAALQVKEVEPLVVELTRNIGATTERSNDGKAQVAVKGGTPKYSIAWDTKQTGLAASKLPLGPHSVTVTDANGCIQQVDFQTEKRILPELTGKLESGQTIRMRLLNFDTDSYIIKESSLPMLDELYDFMMEHGTVAIEIAGHTNNQPSDAFADELSTNRAKAVFDYLTEKGVDPKRVVYKGYGKRYPLVPNTSAEGRRTNQRVEIKILKLAE